MAWLTRVNVLLARLGMVASVAGLLVIVAIVFYQVVGRYVFNSSPTWAENLALVLVLYVTLIGAAVGVRDGGHIGIESLLDALPQRLRARIELLAHVLVAAFGAAMVVNGWLLGASVAGYKIANLPLSEAVRYGPLVVSGAMIVLFALEHCVALACGRPVAAGR